MTDRRKKLSDKQIKEIQTLYKVRVPVKQIAEHYNVSAGTISYHTGQGFMLKLTVPEVLEAIAA